MSSQGGVCVVPPVINKIVQRRRMSDEETGCPRAAHQGGPGAVMLCLAPVQPDVAALALLFLTWPNDSKALKNEPSSIL